LNVALQSPATQVLRGERDVEVRYLDSQGAAQSERGDACVIATPLPPALMLFPEARAHWGALADQLGYCRGLCVHLGYGAPTKTRSLIVLMPPSEHAEIALLFCEHNKSPDRAPASKALITVFFDDTQIERPWQENDAALCQETAAAVERWLPELAGRLEMSRVTRWPYGVTRPVTGLYKTMHAANERARLPDRVQLAGDFRSTTGQNSAVASGNDAARHLIRHFGDSAVT
jgi:predicted NAD/FAD-dependent oxidoreductase